MSLTDKQLTWAIYSSWDFQQALSALTFLLEECEYSRSYSRVELRRLRCYETTCIISLARPFEQSRSGTTLSLKALGVMLNRDEQALLDKILHLRRKVVAHSDEGEMYFSAGSHVVFEDCYIRFPHLQFNESLELNELEARGVEMLLRKLIDGISRLIFEVAQSEPGRLESHRIPLRMGT